MRTMDYDNDELFTLLQVSDWIGPLLWRPRLPFFRDGYPIYFSIFCQQYPNFLSCHTQLLPPASLLHLLETWSFAFAFAQSPGFGEYPHQFIHVHDYATIHVVQTPLYFCNLSQAMSCEGLESDRILSFLFFCDYTMGVTAT